jgi:hypothetical protein
MTPAAFLQAFPEFSQTLPSLIATRLAFAATKMGGPDPSVWPNFALPGQPPSLSDMAQGFLCAHFLQTSPFGSEMRIDISENDGNSVYLKEYWDIAVPLTGGMLVAGVGVGFVQTTGTGRLVLEPGAGTVALVNGSLNVQFQLPQTLAQGTVLAFVGAQPGALYALAFPLVGTTGNLTAAYTGPTNPASSWNSGAL